MISLKLSGMFDEVVDVTSTSGLIASANASVADALTVNASSNHRPPVPLPSSSRL